MSLALVESLVWLMGPDSRSSHQLAGVVSYAWALLFYLRDLTVFFQSFTSSDSSAVYTSLEPQAAEIVTRMPFGHLPERNGGQALVALFLAISTRRGNGSSGRICSLTPQNGGTTDWTRHAFFVCFSVFLGKPGHLLHVLVQICNLLTNCSLGAERPGPPRFSSQVD